MNDLIDLQKQLKAAEISLELAEVALEQAQEHYGDAEEKVESLRDQIAVFEASYNLPIGSAVKIIDHKTNLNREGIIISSPAYDKRLIKQGYLECPRIIISHEWSEGQFMDTPIDLIGDQFLTVEAINSVDGHKMYERHKKFGAI